MNKKQKYGNTGREKEYVTADELRNWGPLLKMDLVRPGDVLLTNYDSRESRLIKRLGAGGSAASVRFSHASLWIRSDRRPIGGRASSWWELELIEADDFGVGPTPLELVALEVAGEQDQIVAKLPENPRVAALFRHPGINAIDVVNMSTAVENIRKYEYYRSYPRLSRLVNATNIPNSFKPMIGKILETVAARSGKRLLEGPFCSELVAKFFAELGLSVLKVPLIPDSISPNHYAGGVSYLEERRECFVYGNEIRDDTVGRRLPSARSLGWGREKALPYLVDHSERTAKFAELTDITVKLLRDTYQSNNDKTRAINVDLHNKIERLSGVELPVEMVSSSTKIAEISQTSRYAYHLDKTLQEFEREVLWEGELHQRYAILFLRHLHTITTHKLSYDYIRTAALVGLRLNKILNKKNTNSNKERRNVIREWIEIKKSRKPVSAFIQGTLGDNENFWEIYNSQECQYYIIEIINAISNEKSQ